MNAFILFPLLTVAVAVCAFLCPEYFARASCMVVPGLMLAMLGMGATLTPADFARALKRPKAVGVGMLMQFGIMPLTACVLAFAFRLQGDMFAGLVLTGAVAGGTASNVITYIAGGDVALSVTMTACSTLLGVVLTPLLCAFYLGATVEVPVAEMLVQILEMVALPVLAGLALNFCLRKHPRILRYLCPALSVFGIWTVLGIVVALNREALTSAPTRVFAAVALHNILGLALGYFGARCLRCDRRTALTVAIETGMQNSGLAAALAKQCFTVAAALPAAIFSVWHNLLGALFAGLARLRSGGENT